MERHEQIIFVITLMTNISNSIKNDIEAGKVPESWDGIELRQLIADRAKDAMRPVWRQMNIKRRRAYSNIKLINNL